MTPYRIAGQDRPGGLLFGYGSVTEASIDEGVRLIATAMAQARIGHATG